MTEQLNRGTDIGGGWMIDERWVEIERRAGQNGIDVAVYEWRDGGSPHYRVLSRDAGRIDIVLGSGCHDLALQIAAAVAAGNLKIG